MKKNKIFCTLFILLNLNSFAQLHQMGFSVGNGITTTNDKSWFLFDYKKNNLTTVEFSYSYFPKEAIFNLNTGLIYNYIEGDDLFLNYLKIPVGVDFVIGDKVQFTVGGGLYSQLLIHKNTIEVKKNINPVQLGGVLKIGILVKMKENIIARLTYSTTNDFTALYNESRMSPGGAYYDEKKYLKSNYLSLGILYNLSKR
jgi:hypothetical protein